MAENAQVLSIALFFLGCLIFFGLMTPTFLTTGSILNVVRQAPILIVAVAMTLVIITAGVDLSVGSMVALVNALAAIFMGRGWTRLLRSF